MGRGSLGGWALLPCASGRCQRARRRRACTLSLSPRFWGQAGGGAGRPLSGRYGAPSSPSFARLRTLFPGLAVEKRPPPPGLALGPKNHGEHDLLCFFLLKLNLQRKFLKLYPCGLVIDLYKSRLRCTPISAGAFVFFLLPSGL